MPSSSANIRDIVGVDDFVLLGNIDSVDEFMENLRKRFLNDIIYTYIGQVLISVNPYKELPIYKKEIAQQYKNTNTYEAKPHIFAIAATSYRSMIDEIQDQCILISGESGSGKTEASKKILEYIAYNCVQSQTLQNVKDKLLSTNPVLEVFGNAKTVRNNNSSRFGKYMDVEFNRIGQPIGGHINIFMLEKSRVIYQNPNERNFHIFYQLLRGLDDETLKQLHLIRDINAYFYLNQTSQEEFDEIPNQFDLIQNAFKHFEFSAEEEVSVYKIIASILHLGNIGFYADDDDNEERAVIGNVKPVTIIANLLECDRELLALALTSRTIKARDETLLTSLNREQAIYGRDALAKAVYERLFFWLVSRLNSSLKCSNKVPAKLLMGLVDIYGFEVFETNHFEQFCINYCNEKLQQLFIELTLKQEQEEYRREKIDWEPVKYFNNKIICDMIEEKHNGIIAYLDEECFRPGEATDLTFLNKLERNLGSNPHFKVKRNYSNNKNRLSENGRRLPDNHFTITHYAGEVEYSVSSFLDKNNDQLHRELKKAMLSSKNAILSKLFHVEELNSLKRPNTTATQFRASLSKLMELLSTKQPWYIRCIKPNEEQVRSSFNENIVAHQIQYLGLMENLRVRRAGFAYRRKFEDFLKRYKCISPQTWPHVRGPARDGVSILMKHLKFDENLYKLGLTKIFIRFPETFFKIEDALQQQKHVLASKIQALYKGYKQRLIYERWRLSAIQIQSHVRKLIAKKTYERRKQAVQTLRRFIKGFINRNVTPNDENDFFLRQVKVEWLRRLSRNLPQSVLDRHWMPASSSCDKASELLARMHRTYLARKYVRELSNERKVQLGEKLFAEQLFKNKKASYLKSVADLFVSDRIGQFANQLKLNRHLERIKGDREKIQYMNLISKYDRHGYKKRERIVVITDKKLYLFDPKNCQLKETIPHLSINSVVLSNRYDGVFVVKITQELKNQKGDLILESSMKLIELITKLVKFLGVNKLMITDSNAIKHTVSGGKEGKISFIDGNRNEIMKNKTDGTLNVMSNQA